MKIWAHLQMNADVIPFILLFYFILMHCAPFVLIWTQYLSCMGFYTQALTSYLLFFANFVSFLSNLLLLYLPIESVSVSEIQRELSSHSENCRIPYVRKQNFPWKSFLLSSSCLT